MFTGFRDIVRSLLPLVLFFFFLRRQIICPSGPEDRAAWPAAVWLQALWV